MRRTLFRTRPSRVPVAVRLAGLAVVIVAGLSTILGALPLGGHAYYGVYRNLMFGATSVPAVTPFQPVTLPATGGELETFPTSWHPFTGVPAIPTVLNAEGIQQRVEGDPEANTARSRAESTPFAILPYPQSSSLEVGLIRGTGFVLDAILRPSGFRTDVSFPGIASTWPAFAQVFDPALWAQAPPNVRLTIDGLGDVYLHEVERTRDGNQTVVTVNGLRLDLDVTSVPPPQPGQEIPTPITGEIILGHVEVSGTRPQAGEMSPTTGDPGTEITIQGSGFRPGDTIVEFAGIPSPEVTVISSTQLTAVVPELLGGTWPVRVKTPVDSDVASDEFTSDATPSGSPVYGAAFGVWSSIDPADLPFVGPVTYGPEPEVELPEGGGSAEDTLLHLPALPGANLLPGGLLRADLINVSTEGSPASISIESEANSSAFNIGGGLLQADSAVVRSWLGPSGLRASVTLAGLRSNVLGDLSHLQVPAPNTTLEIPGLGEVVLNEQIEDVDPETGMRLLTVNGLNVSVNMPGLATGDLIFLQASAAAAVPGEISSLDPDSGPETGGTLVTITGSGFGGNMSVTFDDVPGLDVTVNSATELTVVTPPHAPDTVDVVVTGPAGSETLPDAFTYVAVGEPGITGITPSSGPIAGGILATITGTNFLPGALVSFGDAPSTMVTVGGSTTLQVLVPAAPGGMAGSVDVVVETPRGSATLMAGFAYEDVTIDHPTITGVDPSQGPAGTTVTVTGTGFQDGATVTICSQILDPASVTPTALDFTAPSCGPGGPQDVTVANPDGGFATLPGAFTYPHIGPTPPPTITSVTPATGPVTGGTLVTITGTYFVVGSTVVMFGDTPAPVVNVLNATRLQVQVPSAPNGEAGPVDVEVVTPNGAATRADGFTYTTDPVDPPTITEISPSSGDPGTTVTMTGTGFQDGATVTICRQTVTPQSVSSTEIVFTAPGCPAGGVQDVTVTNPDGGFATAPGGFTYSAGAPTVDTVSPPSGLLTGGTLVTIRGSGFVPGTDVTFGDEASPSVSYLDPATLQAMTPPAPGGAPGPVDVVVTTPGGSATLEEGFTYLPAGVTPPTITSASPTHGDAGTAVTLTGDGFQLGATVMICGQTIAPVSVSTSEVVFQAPPCSDRAPQDITVMNPDGGSATLFDGFTYGALPPPTISSIAPPSGPVDGGTLVVITGTGFNGTSVTFGGTEASEVTVVNSTTLLVVTPPAPGGQPAAVDVVVETDGGSVTAPGGFTYFGPGVTPPTIDGVSPTSGTAGTVVTITGTGFQPGVVVMICGQQVTPSAETATEVVFTAPPCLQSGPQDIIVINPDGGSAVLAVGFTYGPVLPPTVSRLDPNFGPHEGGTEVVVVGTNFVADATVTFGTEDAPVTPLNATTLLVVTPPNPATSLVVVDVTLTTPGGEATLPGGFTYATPTDGDCAGDGMSDEDKDFFGLDVCDPTGDNGPDGDPDGDGIPNDDEINGEPPSHPRGFYSQYLAEGATGFFDTTVGVFNPTGAEGRVLVTLFPEAPHAPVSLRRVMGPFERWTVDVNEQFPDVSTGVSIRVESDEPVTAMRQMFWDRPTAYGGTLESGAPRQSRTWFFAEGATHIFDLFYLLVNTNPTDPANVTVRYLRGEGAPIEQQVVVPPSTRHTILVNNVPGMERAETSAEITSDIPIVAERAMYLSVTGRPFEAGQGGLGATAPSTDWFLAEGSTAFFDTFLAFGNPGNQPAEVSVTYQLRGGATIDRQYTVPAQSRRTIYVDGEDPRLDETQMGMVVSSTQPIVAERAMWWGPSSESWYEAHGTVGSTESGVTWAVGEGICGGPTEEDTYILVTNMDDDFAWVQFTVSYEDGTVEERIIDMLPRARMTVLMSDVFPACEGQRFSVRLDSKPLNPGDIPAPLAVEVSRYLSTEGIFGNAGGAAIATKIQ